MRGIWEHFWGASVSVRGSTQQPPTDTLLRMAELVLTLNTFELNGEYYKQTGGVAMGSRVGPKIMPVFLLAMWRNACFPVIPV